MIFFFCRVTLTFVLPFISKFKPESCGEVPQNFIFSKPGFEWLELDRKWGFNLILTSTRAKTLADMDFRYCKMIICTKIRSSKTTNFKKKLFQTISSKKIFKKY